MRVSGRKLTGLGLGLLAYFVVRRPSRQERRRARREAIYRSYALTAEDPEFMAEHRELMRELDTTAADGLGEVSVS